MLDLMQMQVGIDESMRWLVFMRKPLHAPPSGTGRRRSLQQRLAARQVARRRECQEHALYGTCERVGNKGSACLYFPR